MPSNFEWITGPVHTGKTTRLTERIADHADQYAGLLAPVDLKGNRYLQDIISGERRKLDCELDTPNAIIVGPYIFNGEVFAWGRAVLASHHEQYLERTLVIDEIGKLELRGAGLANVCWEVIALREARGLKSLIVVRDSLVARVKSQLSGRG